MTRRGGPSWVAAASLDEAVRVLAKEKGVFLLAGGTDLIPRWKYGLLQPRFLLSLEGIPELREIRLTEEGVSIGAMATLAELAAHSQVARWLPALCFSARSVASPQIRNRGTVGGNLMQERRCMYFNQTPYWRQSLPACLQLGGNICHQVPSAKRCRAVNYSDLAPVLWAFDAVAETQGNAGVERISVREFLNQRAHGPRDSRILTRLVVPRPSPGSWGAFLKHGKRAAVDFATTSLAVRFSPSGADGSGEPALRLVLGAVGPLPVELEETATFLLGHLDRARDVAEEAGRMARREAAARSSLIRETAVSPTEKKAAAGIVDRGFSLLLDRLCR